MNDEIKEILSFDVNADYKRLSIDEITILKDYITNLQEKINQYENPDDLTLFYMWLDEKAKDKMKELQTTVNNCKEENEGYKQEREKLFGTIHELQKSYEKLERMTKNGDEDE